MKKLLLLFVSISLVACGGSKKAVKSDKYTIESLQNKNYEQILGMYSDANPKNGSEMMEEGTVERPYTILYPGTEDEILITWKNESKTSIFDISYSENGKWSSAKGIKIGTTYDELTRINGKEVKFYGFGWDYSGAVDWNGGKLEDSNIRVFLNPQGKVAGKFYGDRMIDATPEEIEALNLKVSTIMYRD
ncbi:hypothetical protein SAMN04487907_101728 [Zunongwangia mangrovi]|uniref:Lipoprotein n=1 Tax=Zunongwangia mangrovi TaxID=1334022 RepID=A0A1I1E154_9FLAO|nr:hypothetical protein [Zunongwangia mangrovi]SFB80901.1 hypothetical protein SAMN04487907_101728 [Zunongwangia mangrovi]